MAGFGTWRAPAPIRLGGNGHVRITEIYDSLRANIGSAFSNESLAINNVEDQAYAKCLSIADRAIDRRLTQIDPTKLSTMLERWEEILQITASTSQTLYERRQTVAARLTRDRETEAGFVSQVVADAFAPWSTKMHYSTNSGCIKYWPGSTYWVDGSTTSTTFPWYSTVAHVCVEYYLPDNYTTAERTSRRAAATSALDALLPAWVTFALSETAATGAAAGLYGFYLDNPNLDKCAFA